MENVGVKLKTQNSRIVKGKRTGRSLSTKVRNIVVVIIVNNWGRPDSSSFEIDSSAEQCVGRWYGMLQLYMHSV